MQIHRRVSLAPLHALACEVIAECLIVIENEWEFQQLPQVLSQAPEPFWMLGCGTNMVFAQDFPGTLIQFALTTSHLLEEDSSSQVWRVGAGVNWHQWVLQSLGMGLSGLENLSLIPGTVGAAPIQNIGAYGVEFVDVCQGVSLVELKSGQRQYVSAQACGFAYRSSHFKQGKRWSQWAVTSVDMKLSKVFIPQISYPDLQHLQFSMESTLSAKVISDTVIAIRQKKLPDPKKIPNVGSFFKNPVVSSEHLQALKKEHSNLVYFALPDDQYKLAAAWLIDQCGWKGKRWGLAQVHQQHALVLVCNDSAGAVSVMELAQAIVEDVWKTYGVVLQFEPMVWS